MKPLKVLFVASEANPLVKVGGLGDVAGSLPRALRQAGHDVRLAVPAYGSIDLRRYSHEDRGAFSIPFMGGREEATISEVNLPNGTPAYLVGNQRLFGRPAVYGEPDDVERFLLFCVAAMELPKKVEWQPDVINCHDWHTGMIPALLDVDYRSDPFYSGCASVFTINNLAYQGGFDKAFATRAGLDRYLSPPTDPLRSRSHSMMGMGIIHADAVSTVSEWYAREVLTPEYGMGLELALQRRKDSFYGIRNGVDYDVFNPATDEAIAQKYDSASIEKKLINKTALQKRAGLPVNADIPLIGMTTRLVWQKGLDITAGALESLLDDNVQFILQGAGEEQYRAAIQAQVDRHLDKACLISAFDPALAQQIYAGADMFLMPSRFEPCGLAHLIAMHYGAIPIVRRTGGLAETVSDCPPDLSTGLGFVFEKYDAGELLAATRRAITAFGNKKAWKNLMVRAMEQDFSWYASVPKYEKLYETARLKVSVQRRPV